MRCLELLALTLLVSATMASAAPRFAVVRVNEIYLNLPSTATILAEAKDAQNEILRDTRANRFRQVIAELEVLQGQLQDKENPPDAETQRELSQAYEIKHQEAKVIQREYEEFRAARTKEINREMVAAIRASLDRINQIAARLGKEQGFDAVFDSSGESNTGLPVLIYSKDAVDLTEGVIAALAESAVAPPSDAAKASP